MLNLAPPTNTTIPATAMSLYKQLGDFVKKCYGDGTFASETALNSTVRALKVVTVTLTIGGGGSVGGTDGGGGGSIAAAPPPFFDRVQLKEDLTSGQLVTGFQILADSTVVFNGTSVGANMVAQLNVRSSSSRVSFNYA